LPYQCFDAVGWAAGRASGLKKMSGEVLACYLSGVRCRFAYGPADATVTHYLAPVNPDWLYQNGSAFLVPAYPGCPEKKAVKRM